MSISQRKRLIICCIAALACALGAAAGLYFALTQGYDAGIRHFEVASPGGNLAARLCILGIVISLVAAILLRKDKTATATTPGTLTTFAAIVTAPSVMPLAKRASVLPVQGAITSTSA